MNLKYAPFCCRSLQRLAAAHPNGGTRSVRATGSGSLDKKVIKDVIREHHREVRRATKWIGETA